MRQDLRKQGQAYVNISIHAPLTGCDNESQQSAWDIHNFNPRTPYGMRPCQLEKMAWCWIFQSTHPLRDATGSLSSLLFPLCISIHAPLTGCDMMRWLRAIHLSNFNPRTPYGMRPFIGAYRHTFLDISIHAPLTGCDVTFRFRW